jgi:hypothetical protein
LSNRLFGRPKLTLLMSPVMWILVPKRRGSSDPRWRRGSAVRSRRRRR